MQNNDSKHVSDLEVVHKFYCEIDLVIAMKFTQNDVPIYGQVWVYLQY